MILEDMDQGPVVLDISSDEEPIWVEPISDDFDWLSELLSTEDDSDEVVVVSEVNPRRRPKSAKPMVREPDDDCVVLDCDPDKSVKAVDEAENCSDEVLIVGEKGQVACRDFPHPRHLCATFPFRTTPHQTHCHLCHCYVCDLQAPCLHWGAGVSCSDHCHATDKEETWEIQRKNLKLVKNVPLQSSKFPGTCPAVAAPQSNQVRPLIIRLSSDSRPHNQFPRPATIRPCSSSANFPVSNIVNQGRSQQSGYGLGRNRFPLRSVPRHSLGSRIVNVQGSKGEHVSNLGPRFAPYLPMVKRPGTTGASFPAKQSSYSSLNYSTVSADTSQYATNQGSNDLTIRWENFSNSMPQSSPMSNLASAPLPKAQTYGDHMPPSSLNHSQSFYQQANQFQNNGQTIFQCGNQSENESHSFSQDNNHGANLVDGYIDSEQNLVNDNTRSNQQLLPNEHSQLQSTDYTNETSIQEFEKWLLDDHFLNGSLPPIPNVSSNQSVPIETGMLLFDFETSLNGLMHTK